MRWLGACLFALSVIISLFHPYEGLEATNSFSSYVFEEHFTSYAYKANARDAEWDIQGGQLGLMPQDTVTQEGPAVAAMPGEGSFVVWNDERHGGSKIYAQRLDAFGNRMWPEDVQVSRLESVFFQSIPAITLDGTGGVIVTWSDARTGTRNIYAQRLSYAGTRVWAQDVPVGDGNSVYQNEPDIANDGLGNVIIAWSDERNSEFNIYAQKLTLDGQRLWAQDALVSQLHWGTFQFHPTVVADGSGGAWIGWEDARDDHECECLANTHGYVQRIDSNGSPQLVKDHRVDAGDKEVFHHTLVMGNDGNHGAWVWWIDFSPTSRSVRGTHLTAETAKQERFVYESMPPVKSESPQRFALQSINGLSQTPFDFYLVGYKTSVTSDGAGGQFVGYTVDKSSAGVTIFRVDPLGNSLWSNLLNIPLSKSQNTRLSLSADGSGGVWVGWEDMRRLWGDIYVQRISGMGELRWPNEVRCHWDSGIANKQDQSITLDVSGNMWVTWEDTRHGTSELYVQKITPAGLRSFADTVSVSSGPHSTKFKPKIAPSATGGALIAWWDTGQDSGDTYTQLLDANGNRQWVDDKRVNQSSSHQASRLALTSDGNGGYFVVWVDNRLGGPNIYMQHLNGNGEFQWSGDLRVNDQGYYDWHVDPSIISDGQGGAIVAWSDNRETYRNVFLQRIDTGGNRLWAQDVRAAVTPGTDDPNLLSSWHPGLVSDGAGGALVAWKGPNNALNSEILVQRISASGERVWANDLEVSQDTNAVYRNSPFLGTNGQDFRVGWAQGRSDSEITDIYAQRIDKDGNVLWSSDIQVGEDLSQDQFNPVLVVDQHGNMVVVWGDYRHGARELYVQRMDSTGTPLWANDLSVGQDKKYFVENGSAESLRINVSPDAIARATLTADYIENGGEVSFFLSNDGGISWQDALPGHPVVFATTGNDLRWRVDIKAHEETLQSPLIETIHIEYDTQVLAGDDYELDDTCAQATPLQVNGTAQAHTFHKEQDEDWIWFEASAGTTYIVQAVHTGPDADLELELHLDCEQPATPPDDNDTFGNDARLIFVAPTSGNYYLKSKNFDPAKHGDGTGYQLSVRTQRPSSVAVIIAGRNERDQLEQNIIFMGDQAYRAFRRAGISRQNIHYLSIGNNRDADQDGNLDVDGFPTWDKVRAAIEDWPREQGVQAGVPFYLYIADHGSTDFYCAAGCAIGKRVTASDLNLWLSNLESTSGADEINIIIEACYSGSFIDVTQRGPVDISAPGRVVITSTGSSVRAFASQKGAYFSDAFFTALGDNADLWEAYLSGRTAIHAAAKEVYEEQTPWLDDNGDAVADGSDGQIAQRRGLLALGGGSIPEVEWIEVGQVSQMGMAPIQVRARDDIAVVKVSIELFPPGLQVPNTGEGETPLLPAERFLLTDDDGDGVFEKDYAGFAETGTYRLVAYAWDSDGNISLPHLVEFSGNQIFIPLVTQP